ncbi:MAG: hypothetical protein CMJ18_04745 [Phycisphaeraceae bacterium]|nr:hypothetical protein [Phycisphaeraceae bacterium]
MLIPVVLAALTGCTVTPGKAKVDPGPYDQRVVYAIAPPLNESGSLHVDPPLLADHLARAFENVRNIDVLPVNRTLAAMEQRGLTRIMAPSQALDLLRALDADALVIGVVATYDPYDPPKMAMALDLYYRDGFNPHTGVDPRVLTRAASGPQTTPAPGATGQPVTAVSGSFDAADPRVRWALKNYAWDRGDDVEEPIWRRLVPNPSAMRRHQAQIYRISMDLFSQFVTHEMGWRLIEAERRRLAPVMAAHADP